MTMQAVAKILNSATVAKKQRRFEEALALLEPLLAADIEPVGALLLASDCAQLLDPSPEGHRRAEGYLRRALELDPNSVEATLELGHLLHTAQPGGSQALEETLARATLLVDQAEITLTLLRAAVLRDQRDLRAAYDVVVPAAARHPGSKLLARELTLLKNSLGVG